MNGEKCCFLFLDRYAYSLFTKMVDTQTIVECLASLGERRIGPLSIWIILLGGTDYIHELVWECRPISGFIADAFLVTTCRCGDKDAKGGPPLPFWCRIH